MDFLPKKLFLNLVSLLGIASLAQAEAPVVPSYGSARPEACAGPACVSVIRNPNMTQLNVRYTGYLSDVTHGLAVAVAVDGDIVAESIASYGRNGFTFNPTLPRNAQGNIELFFYDEAGRYDSNLGRNYKFLLSE